MAEGPPDDMAEGPTRGEAAGPRWRSAGWGLHVPSRIEASPEQRVVEASARLSVGMVTGWAALRLAGARYFDGTDGTRSDSPVPLLLPHSHRLRARGVLVERTRGSLPEPVVRHGVPCAPGPTALWHELVRCTDRIRAGVMVDMALAAEVVTLPEVQSYASHPRPRHFAAYAVERACPHCRSPKESEMLQVWQHELGFPRPGMNVQVLDLAGRRLAVVDLLDAEAGVYGEYNGAAHRSRERQRRDEERAERLREVGLEGFVLVAGDSRKTWRDRMSAARRRAQWLPEEQRRWRAGAVELGSAGSDPALPTAAEEELIARLLDERRRDDP